VHKLESEALGLVELVLGLELWLGLGTGDVRGANQREMKE